METSRFPYHSSAAHQGMLGNAAFVFHSLMIRQGPSGSYMNEILILCLFQFGCFGISSSSLVTALAFSFLRSMRRAAFFCFFSRRAVSFCLFLKVSLALKTPFQLWTPPDQLPMRSTMHHEKPLVKFWAIRKKWRNRYIRGLS